MKVTSSIARRFVIAGVLTSFAAISGTAAFPADGPSARRQAEVRYARLDPAAVLGGHDGLMPPSERDRPHEWEAEPRRRRTRPTERRGEERRQRDADRTRDRS